jgi:hypothetical protein
MKMIVIKNNTELKVYKEEIPNFILYQMLRPNNMISKITLNFYLIYKNNKLKKN